MPYWIHGPVRGFEKSMTSEAWRDLEPKCQWASRFLQTFASPFPHPLHGKRANRGRGHFWPPSPSTVVRDRVETPKSYKHPSLGPPKDRPLEGPSYKMCVDLGCHEGARIRSSRHQALVVLRSFVSTTVVFVPFAEVPSSRHTLGITDKGNTPGI